MDDPASLSAIILWVGAVITTWMMAAAERLLSAISRPALEKMVLQEVPRADRLLNLYSNSVCRRRLEIMPIAGRGLAAITGAGAASFLTISVLSEQIPISVAIIIGCTVSFCGFLISWLIPTRSHIHDELEQAVSRLTTPLLLFYNFLLPLTATLDSLLPALEKDPDLIEAERAELRALVENETDDGVIEADKARMINSILGLVDTSVKEVMVPRVSMVCFDVKDGVDALLSLISSSPHTRIPIYEDSVDTIIGVVHTKDILQKVVGSDKPLTDIRSLIRPDSAMFVPENKKVDEMLLEFRMERKHLAIVVDEYGGTEGLVTFEDLLEEIVGDIRDEYDEAEESDWVWLDDNTIVVDGAATISNVNEETGADIPDEHGYETLAGFLYQKFGTIPKPKDTLHHGRWELIAEQVVGQRIHRVKMVRSTNGNPVPGDGKAAPKA